jgi:hypothetical protein
MKMVFSTRGRRPEQPVQYVHGHNHILRDVQQVRDAVPPPLSLGVPSPVASPSAALRTSMWERIQGGECSACGK